MSNLKIVIPSHKRHDRVFAKKLVNNPIICVAESQADLYRQYNPERSEERRVGKECRL